MILLIGGEKGGAGKSTIATNIAVNLAHQQQEVVIIDCGLQNGYLDVINYFLICPKYFLYKKQGIYTILL